MTLPLKTSNPKPINGWKITNLQEVLVKGCAIEPLPFAGDILQPRPVQVSVLGQER